MRNTFMNTFEYKVVLNTANGVPEIEPEIFEKRMRFLTGCGDPTDMGIEVSAELDGTRLKSLEIIARDDADTWQDQTAFVKELLSPLQKALLPGQTAFAKGKVYNGDGFDATLTSENIDIQWWPF